MNGNVTKAGDHPDLEAMARRGASGFPTNSTAYGSSRKDGSVFKSRMAGNL